MTVRTRFSVLLVGAGEINFGSPEGPWNHTARLEAILGHRLCVLGIVDPNTGRSKQQIAAKQGSAHRNAWLDTIAFGDVDQASSTLSGKSVDLIVLGCPPHFRGTSEPGKNMDTLLLKAFPNARGMLIEKPIAASDPALSDCSIVSQALHTWSFSSTEPRPVSVGYMLRYLKPVAKIREIIAENHLTPTCINARYFMAYEFARKLSWWNKKVSCGPVIEQSTHFVDLIRFVAGSPALLNTVQASAVEHNEPAGKLSKLGFDEDQIEAANRVPRVTTAMWKHEKGTIGTLCHGITLHNAPYETEFEVLADGWIMKLRDAYSSSPSLTIWRPGSVKAETLMFEDDPFLSEFETLVTAIDGNTDNQPLSSFEDALETYKLTWTIRHASENK